MNEKRSKYAERLRNLSDKVDKLHMLEALLHDHEKKTDPDVEYIRDLKRRANEIRTQIKVTSI